jgi:hypothetical protein
MGETNSPSVAHVGYDISPLSRVNVIMREVMFYTGQLTTVYYKDKVG